VVINRVMYILMWFQTHDVPFISVVAQVGLFYPNRVNYSELGRQCAKFGQSCYH
jgi:hypothetical protein